MTYIQPHIAYIHQDGVTIRLYTTLFRSRTPLVKYVTEHMSQYRGYIIFLHIQATMHCFSVMISNILYFSSHPSVFLSIYQWWLCFKPSIDSVLIDICNMWLNMCHSNSIVQYSFIYKLQCIVFKWWLIIYCIIAPIQVILCLFISGSCISSLILIYTWLVYVICGWKYVTITWWHCIPSHTSYNALFSSDG